MPYGSTNGGSPPGGLTGNVPTRGGVTQNGLRPVFEKTKSVSYNSDNSDQIYSVGDTTSATAPSVSMPRAVEVANTGATPLTIMVGYKTYSDEDTIGDSGGTRYVHYMLMPGESYNPPVRGVIMNANDANVTQFDGTIVDNAVPASVMYSNSGADTTEGFADDDDTTITFDDGSGAVAHTMFKVNDLIRLDNEVCKITSIVDTAGDGAYTPAHFVVDRAVYGTAKADHTNNTDIRFPFFNAYHDYARYSVAQTDENGKFKAFNMFGVGRSAADPSGIVPGSFAIKFYQPGYQRLGLSGITSSTNTGLTAGETLKLDITVDGGTLFQDLTFTLDTSNVNFGGTNGFISKIQSALDTQFYTSGNLFGKKVIVGIVDGDVRFTSGSHLSTSAILLADTGDSDTLFDSVINGRMPAVALIPAAIPAKLPDDNIYDNVTYATTPNTAVFGYDDGNGRLFGMCGGTINYETGAIDMTGCPANAEFVYSVAHKSAFSGKLGTSSTVKGGALTDILVNTPSQKTNGSVRIKTY